MDAPQPGTPTPTEEPGAPMPTPEGDQPTGAAKSRGMYAVQVMEGITLAGILLTVSYIYSALAATYF